MVTRWTWADIIRSNHHLDKCLYLKTYLLTFPTISPCRSWWTRILTTLPTFRRSALSKLRLVVTSIQNINHFCILSGCQPSLHYQLSILWNLQQVKVTPGDSLMTTCTYDTTERTNVTLGGFGFTEEMWELRVLMWRTSLRIASNHLLSIQWCLLLILSVFVTRCVSRQIFENKNVTILVTMTTSQVCKLRALLSANRSGTVQELGGREGARLLLPRSTSWGRAGAAPRSQCVPAVSGGALHSVIIHCQCPHHLSANRCGGLQKEAKSLKSSIFGHRLN